MKRTWKQRWARLTSRARAKLCILWIMEGITEILVVTGSESVFRLQSIHVRIYCSLILLLLLAAFFGFGVLALFYEEYKNNEIIDAENRSALRDFQLKERSQRHDLNIHLMALIGMLDSERYEECKKYLHRMLQSSQQLSQLMPVDDPAISAMLSQAADNAGKIGGTLQVTAYDDLSRISCEAYEVNQILGNLIKNAVEAVKDFPEESRQVEVIFLHRRNQCILRVENEVSPEMDVSNRIFEYGYSGKDGHSGIGLATVKRLVELYHGNLIQEKDGKKLSIIVMLPQKKEKR